MVKVNKLKRQNLIDKYYGYRLKHNICDDKLARIYLEGLLNYFNSYEYEFDDNFIFGGRKKYLYDEVFRVLKGEQVEENPIVFVLNSIEEFMCKGNILYYHDVDKSKWINETTISGTDFNELNQKDIMYTKSGFICEQEKNKIIEMIEELNKYIYDKNSKDSSLKTIIYFMTMCALNEVKGMGG